MAYSYEARLESFSASLAALHEAPLRDREDTFVLSGTSAKFGITFELAWKTMKDALTGYYGVADFVTGSPRDTLRAAFRLGLISDDRWMEMLVLRNQLAHDYDLSTVRAAFDEITTTYLELFDALEDKLLRLGE
jgi:nucleotidyltransferase substrate binding protein (TIGR01987 family)